MIHLYYGSGKGKTTAACGLCVRAAGSGMKVLFVQFFKSGRSSEISVLDALDTVTTRHPPVHYGRYKQLSGEQKSEVRRVYREMMEDVMENAGGYDMIILDEAVSVFAYGLMDREKFLAFLRSHGNRREIVLTGRAPAPELMDLADYATEMRKEKHPFDCGVAARKGIEY